jgi:hypothetical protein
MVRCPKCGHDVVPGRDAGGRLVCPLCRNTGKVQPGAAPEIAAATTGGPPKRAAATPRRGALVVTVAVVGALLVVGGAAAAWFFVWGPGQGGEGGRAAFASQDYLLTAWATLDQGFELEEEGEVSFWVTPSDGDAVFAGLFATEAEATAAREAIEAAATKEEAWAVARQQRMVGPSGGQGEARLAAGKHHFVLLCADYGDCRGSLALSAPEATGAKAGAAPPATVETPLFAEQEGAEVRPTDYRFLEFHLLDYTTLTYEAREESGLPLVSAIMEQGRIADFGAGVAVDQWATGNAAARVANETALTAGTYVLMVGCNDPEEDCRIAVTLTGLTPAGAARPVASRFIELEANGAFVDAGERLDAASLIVPADAGLLTFHAEASRGMPIRIWLVPVQSYAGHQDDPDFPDAFWLELHGGPFTAATVLEAGEYIVLIDCQATEQCQLHYAAGVWTGRDT